MNLALNNINQPTIRRHSCTVFGRSLELRQHNDGELELYADGGFYCYFGDLNQSSDVAAAVAREWTKRWPSKAARRALGA